MFKTTPMSNSTCLSEEARASSGTTRFQDLARLNSMLQSISSTITTDHQLQESKKVKKQRSLPGNPDPDAEVIALSPRTLLATNRFVCEICNKGFQRDQNLQLHRRGHNLPWKLKRRNKKEAEKKKVYICPETSCVHHHPSRALGDFTGVKKHFYRKHGEKKFKCEKCSKIYAVYSDWKAHSKTCGTREYRCDCGTLFSRKDSFVTHRAFCDALAEETARLSAATNSIPIDHPQNPSPAPLLPFYSTWDSPYYQNHNPAAMTHKIHQSLSTLLPTAASEATSSSTASLHVSSQPTSSSNSATSAHLSATALQKACTLGAVSFTPTHSQAPSHQTKTGSVRGGPGHVGTEMVHVTGMVPPPPSDQCMGLRLSFRDLATWQKSGHLTRDFLGLTGHHQHSAGGGEWRAAGGGGHVNVSMSARDVLKYACGLGYTGSTRTTETPMLDSDHPLLKHRQGSGLAASKT